MNWIITASEVGPADRPRIGGKSYALAQLAGNGFTIPETLCLTIDAYDQFVGRTGLRERVLLELNRKDFKEMRWEEIWDCAARIRNMFLRTPMPADVEAQLRREIEIRFKDKPAVVRSSALEEDDVHASFAGLHESYLNLHGTDSILEHIRKVWASLWSDAALLYRQEIGLDAGKSSMAVVIQEIIVGDRSGVAFSRNPNDASQAVIESVYGLNQGLVDGLVEPDRWILDCERRTIVTHTPAHRQSRMVAHADGVVLEALPQDLAAVPPLKPDEVMTVFGLAAKAEDHFKLPQDVEWTFKDEKVFVLQSRPITTLAKGAMGDNRGWYLSLHRSFENLKGLRKKITEVLIPAMIAAAEALAKIDLAGLSDQDLAHEIKRRWEINHKWVNIYWEDFIPFAHGVRLFGQVYNDVMHPQDAYEFVDLLTQTEMASLARNRLLGELANRIRDDKQLAGQLKDGEPTQIDPDFLAEVEKFIQQFGDLSCSMTGGTRCVEDAGPLFKILREMAAHPIRPGHKLKSTAAAKLKEKFLSHFDGQHRVRAAELLDLARASYQLRDDDNIYLGRIEAQLLEAIQAARQRVKAAAQSGETKQVAEDLRNVLDELDHPSETLNPYQKQPGQSFEIKARQLVGQPAGPGLSRGKARVIRQHADLAQFKSGEVLICDAVDPNMTFVVPLASAVVERRGGMLIHGAIIAREYGLPCVTGIPDATGLIQTGEEITVDGYLGIVTVGSGEI
jgi:phosphoenolpyruvate synthase/pyruvate phosphate dikinase